MSKKSSIIEPANCRLIFVILTLIFIIKMSPINAQSNEPLFPKVLKIGNCLEVIVEFKKNDSLASDSTIISWLETLYLITPGISFKFRSYEKLYSYFKNTEHFCTLKRFEPILIQE